MAAFTTIALAVGAGAAAIGTIGSLKAQKKAARAQQQQQTNQRRRSTRQALRQAQIQRAASLSSAGGAGVGDSSGAQGGIRSIGSRAGEAIGFAGQQSALSGIISRQTSRANQFSGLASIGGSVFNLGVGLGGLDKFSSSSTPDFTGNPVTQ